jgi:hypothetical protein
MYTARFITPEEVDSVIQDLFSIDKTITRQVKSEEELAFLRNHWKNLMSNNEMMISVVFDEEQQPAAMYTARLVPKVSGWWVGATKIKKPNTSFYTTAKIMVPGLELLLNTLEAMGYYKFWMVAPEEHHNIRNRIMKKYSPALNRYEWFDELIIPAGGKSDVALFEMHRVIVDWTDTLVRMFVLKQEYREVLVKERHKKRKQQ